MPVLWRFLVITIGGTLRIDLRVAMYTYGEDTTQAQVVNVMSYLERLLSPIIRRKYGTDLLDLFVFLKYDTKVSSHKKYW